MLLTLVSAICIGLSLGLFGSGGSILTVPVLVYVLDQPELIAIASSLAIVGLISLVTVIPNVVKNQISWFHVLYFGVPGMAGTYLGAWFAQFAVAGLQMTVFATLTLSASYMMLRKKELVAKERASHPKTIMDGLIVGTITGFVGVGGGFLIVPALVIFGGLSLTLAVSTSLAIITLKSSSGFYKYWQILADQSLQVDWVIIATVAAMGVVGGYLGQYLSKKLPQQQLRKGFGLFLIVMSLAILSQTLIPLIKDLL